MNESSYYQRNPWIGEDGSQGQLERVLSIAEKSGHLRGNKYETARLRDDVRENTASLHLIQLMKDISDKKHAIDQVKLEIHCRMQDKETQDLTHLDKLEEKIGRISSLNDHVQDVVNNKDLLIHKLQQPFVGDYLKVEATYHRYVSELFPSLAPILADLSTQLDNITWSSKVNMADGKLDTLLEDLASSLASIQSQFQSMSQLRQMMTHIEHSRLSDR